MDNLDWIRNFHLEVLFNMVNEGEPTSVDEAVCCKYIAARYCSKPNHHLAAVERIFGYLKGAINMSLTCQPGKESLLGYSDFDFACDKDR